MMLARLLHRACCLGLAMALTACISVDPASHPSLTSEVHGAVQNGMTRHQVFDRLAVRGFACSEASSLAQDARGFFECARKRDHLWPPYACVQRVRFIAPRTDGERIEGLEVDPPRCAGL